MHLRYYWAFFVDWLINNVFPLIITVDLIITARLATAADATTAIKDFLKDFYIGGGPGREHQKVNQSYKRATDKSISCRARP